MSPSATSIYPAKSVIFFVLTVTVLVLMVAQCSNGSPASPGGPHREISTAAKVRQTRGFRNSALSTARGFGKRTAPDSITRLLSSMITDISKYKNSEISTAWLANLMSKDPKVAQIIVDRYVDTDGDGLLTVDEIIREM